MPPAALTLERPRSVNDALALLSASNDPRILAGGQSLVPLLTLGFAAPETVISLDRCGDLDGITAGRETLRLGAMVTTRLVETDPAVAAGAPLLAEAASNVGSPHVRNFGTLVGNLCHADPGSDLIPAALCLGAEVEVLSARGSRLLDVDELVAAPFMTSLAGDELAVSALVPHEVRLRDRLLRGVHGAGGRGRGPFVLPAGGHDGGPRDHDDRGHRGRGT